MNLTSQPIAIFMLGLPGGGKSTWINENLEIFDGEKKEIDTSKQYRLVSADLIRLNHPRYNPKFPEEIHEECVRLAEEEVYSVANSNYNLVMDGGGINNSYTSRIVSNLKNKGYFVKVVFINTPVSVCLERNNQRVVKGERFVPSSAIQDKAYRLRKSIEKLYSLCDQFIQVDYFTDKYVFVDMDGTVAEYQELTTDENGDINFVEYEVFKYSKPVLEIIKKLEKMSKSKEIFIVSASPNSIANKEKIEWLKINMPFLKDENIYFVGNKNFKTVFIRQLIKKLKIKPNDCMFLDDEHAILEKAKSLNIHPVHPSKLLTNY